MVSGTGAVGRLLRYCAAFGLPLPPLEHDGGELVLSPGLVAFIVQEGISLDWLVCGDRA